MCTSAGLTHESGCMTFIDHHECLILLGKFTDPVKLCDGSIHAENPICHNHPVTKLRSFGKNFFQFSHVVMLVTKSLRLAESDSIDNGSMIQFIADDCVLFVQ